MDEDIEIKEGRALQKAIDSITGGEPFILLRLDKKAHHIKMNGNINDKVFNMVLLTDALDELKGDGGTLEAYNEI